MYEKLKAAGQILIFAACILMIGARFSGELLPVAVGLLSFLLAVFIQWLADHVRREENKKNPIITVEATVVSHRMETHHSRYSTSHTFFVTFKPEDGSENLEFEVPEADYQDFGTGDKGPLRYRTWEYLSFNVKDMSDVKPIAPLPEEYEPAPEPQSALSMAGEKAAALWTKLTSWTAQQSDVAAPPKDDGILTHELDE